jgi:phage N-6-adenine-methyltransferase
VSIAPALVSSNSVEYPTPPELFAALDAEFGFTLDPRATLENAKCSTYFTAEDDGLAQPWAPHVVFCNPPYGAQSTGRWVRKAFEEARRGATVVLLIPARVDTRWWHDCCSKGEIRFLRGRVQFVNGGASPFACVIVVFRPQAEKDKRLFFSGNRGVTVHVGKCDGCGAWLTGKRRHARYCSDACRQHAYRERKNRILERRTH